MLFYGVKGLRRYLLLLLITPDRHLEILMCTNNMCLLSAISRLRQQFTPPNPHMQFILDLQAWLEPILNDGHDIILSIDANETYSPDVRFPSHSLPPLVSTPIVDRHHDGKLTTLIATCNLHDPLALHHLDRPFLASHQRGTQCIDFILVSTNIKTSAVCSGCLPFNSIFHSDHRPYYVDFDGLSLFSDSTHDIHHLVQCILWLQDPRVVQKYQEVLHMELDYHKVYEKCISLHSAATGGHWTADHTMEYHLLDETIMLCWKTSREEPVILVWMVSILAGWSICNTILEITPTYP